MPDVYVGLGSNVDAGRSLESAASALEAEFGPLRRSAVYRSEAVGAPAPDYSNAAVGFSTALAPPALKARLVAIEEAAGRSRGEPRGVLCALDLDLLLYGRRVDARRRLPHPDVLRRAHVLAPLADIASGLVHPLTGERIAELWAAHEPGARIKRAGSLGEP